MRTIDLRSDTVTLPTPEMRRAIAEAALGDDVYHEDPTVNRLEALAAERVGKQAALLVPSGTMGNLLAALAHCARGEEAIVGDESHMYHYEAGGVSVLGGVPLHPVRTGPRGELALADIAGAVRDADDSHEAITRLICLENTHNRRGGVVLPLDYMRAVHDFARGRGLSVHLDRSLADVHDPVLWHSACSVNALFDAAVTLQGRIGNLDDEVGFAGMLGVVLAEWNDRHVGLRL